MVANRVGTIAAGLVACAALAAPATVSAQSRYVDDEPAVVVECAPGQRAVMAQRRVNGATQVVAGVKARRGPRGFVARPNPLFDMSNAHHNALRPRPR